MSKVSAGEIARPRLDRRLTTAAQGRLTLLIAGAGYGKTTLLRGWTPKAPVAWHTVTAADRAPGALARRLVDALRLRIPNLSADLLVAASRMRGHDTDEVGQAEASATALGEAIDRAVRRPSVLVLDDVHEIKGTPEAAHLVATLCRQAPAMLHVVLLSRGALPFRATRLVANGEAVQLNANDLAFTADESAGLVESVLGSPDDALAGAVHQATGGWPVATRLVLEAVAGARPAERRDILQMVDQPRGVLLDYVIDEVVEREDPAVLSLLDRAEPLARVGPALAQAIGVPDAGRLVTEVARRGVYVEPQPGPHGELTLTPLFRGFLRSHRPLPEAQRGEVLASAARWHEQAGDHVQALEYWTRLGDAAQCLRLLESHGADLLAAGEAQRVVDAVDRLPTDLSGPATHLLGGDAWLLLGDWDAALVAYSRASPGTGPVPARLGWRTCLLHYLRGNLDEAAKTCERADQEDPELADRALLLGWSASVQWIRGDLEGCRTRAARAFGAAVQSGDHRALANAHTVLAMVAALDGDREANDAHYLQALDHASAGRDVLQLVRVHSNRSSRYLEEGDAQGALVEVDLALGLADLAGFASFRALALTNRGEALLRLGRLDEARVDLEAARSVYERLGSPMASYPLAWLGDVYRFRGERVAARAAYERAISLAEQVGDAQGLVPALTGLARLLAPDEPGPAADLAARALASGPSLMRVRALLTVARVSLASGDRAAAAARAEQAAQEAHAVRDRAGAAEAEELLAAARGDRDLARSASRRWREVGNPVAAARASLVLAELEQPAVATPLARRILEETQALGARGVAVQAQLLLNRLREVETPRVRVVGLGGFRVEHGGEPVPTGAWKSRKARDLLKVLVCRRGRPVHREQLMGVLWPDADHAQGANRLSVALSTVRSVLDPDGTHPQGYYIRTDGDAVVLEHVAIDVEQFLGHATTGLTLVRAATGGTNATDFDEARAHLEAAELAYTGDLFDDDPYAEWPVDLREQARMTYLDVLRTLAGIAARQGDDDARARYLLRLLERDPFDEQAHLDLVWLLVAAGRHGEARRRYRLYCRRMDEIGVEAAPYPAGSR